MRLLSFHQFLHESKKKDKVHVALHKGHTSSSKPKNKMDSHAQETLGLSHTNGAPAPDAPTFSAPVSENEKT